MRLYETPFVTNSTEASSNARLGETPRTETSQEALVTPNAIPAPSNTSRRDEQKAFAA